MESTEEEEAEGKVAVKTEARLSRAEKVMESIAEKMANKNPSNGEDEARGKAVEGEVADCFVEASKDNGRHDGACGPNLTEEEMHAIARAFGRNGEVHRGG